MHVAILDSVVLNGGDAAILEATLRLIRHALGDDTSFVVFDGYNAAPDYYPHIPFCTRRAEKAPRLARIANRMGLQGATTALRHMALRLWSSGATFIGRALAGPRLRPLLPELSRADLVVVTGGTRLTEYYRHTQRLLDYHAALKLRRPLVLFTQSLGPFTKTSTLRSMAPILKGARFVCVRDAESHRHLSPFSIPEDRILVCADPAFALADPKRVRAAAVDRVPSAPLRVALSIREWAHFDESAPIEGMRRVRDSYRALATHLVTRRAAHVTFVSTCQGRPEYRYDDSLVALQVTAELPVDISSRITVDRAPRTPAQLINFLGTFDITVPMRMHGAILSLVAGTPTLPVAYEFKTVELAARLGLRPWVQDIASITPTSLIQAFEGFYEALPRIRQLVFQRVLEARDDAWRSAQVFRSALDLPNTLRSSLRPPGAQRSVTAS